MFVRPNEALAALAFCARQEQNAELRTLAYSTASKLLKNQSEFFLFIKYCVDLSIQMRGQNRKGFSRGLRNMIIKWYAQFTPLQLADMFGEHRGLHNWTHRDLWKMAHVKPEKEQTPPDADNSTALLETDREMVAKFLFKDGNTYVTEYLLNAHPVDNCLQEGATRMRDLQLFKINEDITKAVSQIRQHKFTLYQTPAHLLESVQIWEALLDTISYNDLLDNFFTLKDFGFLNEDHSFAKKYIDALSKLENCTNSEPPICPISVFIKRQLYEKNVRFLETTKAQKYATKMTKRQIAPNPDILKQLDIVLEHALVSAKPIPAKFFITIDLRKGCQNSKYLLIYDN